MQAAPKQRLTRWRDRWQAVRSGMRLAAPFAGGVVAALIAILLYKLIFPPAQPLTTDQVNAVVAQAMASATPSAAYSAQVYAVIQPSLVLIETQTTDSSGTPEQGLGSGVIIDDQGDILTSLHVVANATQIRVIFADGTRSEAQTTSKQPDIDIAVLQAGQMPSLFVPARLGNPNAMHVGDEAYVVGNPFGLYSSMSAGVISGFDRTFQVPNTDQQLHGLIQIDAAVNPGNSGGPLLNRDGEVIGIIEGLANPTAQDFFVGIGFAVPINTAVSGFGSPPY
jgi:S1-C subfamily serine protease